ncbi:MAG TPA: S46 family peptidase [Bacteroidales bacterium]|nr:S46 family peptidase [Bacteroidales bacterium]
MKKLVLQVVLLLLLISPKIKADEGMWLLPLLEKMNMGKMTELGLKLSAEDIYSLNQPSIKDAVISLEGGSCTGVVVSPEGLILTNHHCGFSQIQSHSSVEHDYLKNGFWAMTKEEELSNEDMFVSFLIRIEDVTDKIMSVVGPEMGEAERSTAINSVRQAIEKQAMEGNDYEAQVSSFYGGNYFYLLVYETYNDVRLVGAPPVSIGKFGSDSDNWEWPRHTVDFSMFRVYTGPDGKPAGYSKDNIPLKPKHYLPVSIKDLNKDDFTMILGYPGTTNRYMTSWEVNELIQITHPNRIKIRGAKQDAWMEEMKADEKVNIQYSDKYFVSSNYWKYSIGQKAGLEKLNIKAEKEELEKQFNTWIESNQAVKAKYGDALNFIRTAIEGRAEPYSAIQYYNETIQGCEIFQFYQIANLLITALKTGEDEAILKSISRIKESVNEIYKDYNPPSDKKAMKVLLRLFRDDVPEKYHPDFYRKIVNRKFDGNIDNFVDDIFEKSVFASESKLNAFLEKPVLKVLENDPAYEAAKSMYSKASEISKENSKYQAGLIRGRRLWNAALMEMAPEKIRYPDANSTMRLSYGTIQDYDPRDGVIYKYHTTMQGMLEKYKPGDYEFDLPERLRDMFSKKEFGRYASSEGYMPVGFLTTNDITGGNSGSPVINANGELIGLAFDGNWESMSGDIAYEPELQRTINVDIRCVLWVIDIYAGAKHLVNEMTVIE